MSWRALTFVVWGCLGAVLVGCALMASSAKERWPDAGALWRALSGGTLRRTLVIVGWMWLGWHVFAR
jgi:hypothetical protein